METKDFKNIEPLKIFIVLHWFWEGDGWLVNSYEDCFLTQEEAVSFAKTLIYSNKQMRIYLPCEEIPDEADGGYGSDGFLQIVQKVFNTIEL